MSNKETLQNHNTKLNTNNNKLSGILEAINNLPEAGGSIQPRYLYLVKDGIEQTDVTGGSTFEYVADSGDNMPGLKFNGDGYLGLCAQVWSFWVLTFNNKFDYKKYSRIYVEWAYPNASTPYATKQSQIALRTSKSDIRTFLTYLDGAKEKTISTLDLSTATEEDQIRLIVGNIGDGDNYTDYPAQIFNLYLEDPSISQDNYLTEEIKTEKVWVDGKPIYRKVLIGNLPKITHDYNTYTQLSFDVANLCIDTPVRLDGVINQSNGYGYWGLNWYHSIVGASAQTYFGDTGIIVTRTNCNWLTEAEVTIILEYTKTTD